MAYTINIADVNVRLGEVWFDYTGKEGVLWRLAIKRQAQKHQKEFVSYRVVNDTNIQYTLISRGEISVNLPSGDAIVAAFLSAQPTTKDELRVFIKTISGDNDENFGGNSFWIVAVNDSNKIMVKENLIAKNEQELVVRMSKLNTIASRLKFYIPTNDPATRSLVHNFFTNNDGTLLEEVEENDVLAHQTPSMQFKQVTKTHKPIKTSKIAAGVLLAFGLFSTGMGFSYFTQKDANNYFSGISSDDGKLTGFNDLASNLEDRGKKWTPQIFRSETLSQFSEQLDKAIYAPLDISLTLRAINRTLPFYAAEWRLIGISYVNNSFFATYERLRGGGGVFFTLDQMLNDISGLNNLVITPYELRDEGNIREYRIVNTELFADGEQSSVITKALADEYAITKETIRLAKNAASDTESLYLLKSEYDELGFVDKWVKRQTLPLHEQAMEIENSINQLEMELDSAKQKRANFVPPTLDDATTLGNILDFVTMMQLDSFFNWSYPSLIEGFPSNASLQQRSEQKNGQAEKNAAYGAAIESYQVKIKSQESEEEGKTTSYGISDLLRLGNLINKPFVKVDEVKYNTTDEQWVVTLHFFRQTGYYTKYIKDNGHPQGTAQ